MTLKEAILTGKTFKRPEHEYYMFCDFNGEFSFKNYRKELVTYVLNKEDLISDDWEVEKEIYTTEVVWEKRQEGYRNLFIPRKVEGVSSIGEKLVGKRTKLTIEILD